MNSHTLSMWRFARSSAAILTQIAVSPYTHSKYPCRRGMPAKTTPTVWRSGIQGIPDHATMGKVPHGTSLSNFTSVTFGS